MVDNGLYGKRGTKDEVVQVNLEALSAAITAWYARRHRQFPNERLKRVTELNQKLFGSNEERKMKTKGAETYGLLRFLCSVFENSLRRLPLEAASLLEACQAMARLVLTFWQFRYSMTADRVQYCFDQLHIVYARTKGIIADDMLIPKGHVCIYLLKDILQLGSPSLYANWYDEALNKMLKDFLRTCSQATIEPFLLLRMKDGLVREGKKRLASEANW